MTRFGGRCGLWGASRGGLAALVALVAVACGGGPDPIATPIAGLPTATAPATVPAPDVARPPQPTVQAVAAPTGVPAAPPQAPTSTPVPATRTPVPTAIPPLTLRLLAPLDGAGVEIGAVGVLGKTRPDAVVAVNGGVGVDLYHVGDVLEGEKSLRHQRAVWGVRRITLRHHLTMPHYG